VSTAAGTGGGTERVIYRQILRDSTRWDGFAIRPGDIVITTPTKCGTTWTQMICALLVFQDPQLPRALDRISPWLDMLTRPLEEVLTDLAAQTHRRFIKTHTPLDGIPFDKRVTYICVGRDPRDVAMSWDNHRENQDRGAMMRARDQALGLVDTSVDTLRPADPDADARDRFFEWVDDDTPPSEAACTLLLTLHHLQTVWDQRDAGNVVLLHYEDLQADLAGQMRELADRLEITVDDACWSDLVDAASLDWMRARADLLAPNAAEAIWYDNKRFFNRGTSGQWRDLLDDNDLVRYTKRVGALASLDLVDWLHREPLP
jgi:hypothetical protein